MANVTEFFIRLTRSQNFTYALYSLAAESGKYLPELRAEAREVFAAGPPTRESIAGLVKIDSFLRESSRIGNDGLCECRVRESHAGLR